MIKQHSWFKRTNDPALTDPQVHNHFNEPVEVRVVTTEFDPESRQRVTKSEVKKVRPSDKLDGFSTRDFSMEVLQSTGADVNLKRSVLSDGSRFALDGVLQAATDSIDYDRQVAEAAAAAAAEDTNSESTSEND